MTIEVDALPFTEEQKAIVREKLAGRIGKPGVLHVTSQVERSDIAN